MRVSFHRKMRQRDGRRWTHTQRPCAAHEVTALVFGAGLFGGHMGRRQKRRKQQQLATAQTQPSATNAQPPSGPPLMPADLASVPDPMPPKANALWTVGKVFLFWLGWALTLWQFGADILPQVTIEPGVSLNAKDPFGSVFVVTNTGKMDIKRFTYSCFIEPTYANLSNNDISDFSTNTDIPAGRQTTIDCGLSRERGAFVFSMPGVDPERIIISVDVRYRLPFLGWERSEEQAFHVLRRDDTGEMVLAPIGGS